MVASCDWQIETELTDSSIARVMSPEGRIDRYSYAGEMAFGNADVETYGELLEMAMADGELAANESMRLEEYRRRHGITMEQHNQLVNQLQHGFYSTTTTAVTSTTMASSSASSSNDTRAFSSVSASRSLKRNPSSANSYLAASSAASRLNLSSARGPAPVAVAAAAAAAAVDETQDAPPTIDSIVAAAQAQQQLEEQEEEEWADVTAEPGTEMSASEALSRLSVKAEEI